MQKLWVSASIANQVIIWANDFRHCKLREIARLAWLRMLPVFCNEVVTIGLPDREDDAQNRYLCPNPFVTA